MLRLWIVLVVAVAPSLGLSMPTGSCVWGGPCGGSGSVYTTPAETDATSSASTPYILSGFSIAHAINWPQEPSGATAYSGTDTDTCAEVASLVTGGSADINATGVGDCSATTLSFSANDVKLTMGNADQFGFSGVSGSRVHVVGGNLNTPASGDVNVTSDALFDNVKIDGTGTENLVVIGNRVAFVNSTLGSGGAALYAPAGSTQTDLILANCLVIGGDGGPSELNARPETVQRLTIVDSFFNGYANQNLRLVGIQGGHIEDSIISAENGSGHVNLTASDSFGLGVSTFDIEIRNVDCYVASDFGCVWFYEGVTAQLYDVNVQDGAGYGHSSYINTSNAPDPVYTESGNTTPSFVSYPSSSGYGADH